MSTHIGSLLWLLSSVVFVACKDKNTEGDDSGQARTSPTYWADIAPLYRDRCVSCHQSGGLGPMPLDTYTDAAQWAEASAGATAARTMPPWAAEGHTPVEDGGTAHAEGVVDPGDCDNHYVDALWLSDDEIATVRAWADAGAPEGTETVIEQPALPALEGTVAAITTPTFQPSPTDGEGGEYDEYRCFLIDPTWTEDTWLTGYEVVPGNNAIVHHVIGMPVDPDRMGGGGKTNQERIAEVDGADGRLGWPCYSQAGEDITVEGEYIAWAPGQGVVHFPEGSGLELNAGEQMVVQIHYNMISTTQETDATTLRLQLAERVERPAVLALVDLWEDEVLPAGEGAATLRWQISHRNMLRYLGVESLVIEGVMPHMHERGTQLTLEVGSSDDDTSCITGVRRWDFSWQRMYFYEDPVVVAEDASVRVTCTYDLSQAEQDVSWGWGTQDEMCLVGLYITEGE